MSWITVWIEIVVFIQLVRSSDANWLYLSQMKSPNSREIRDSSLCRWPGLNRPQTASCTDYPSVMPYVRLGAKTAIFECEIQFMNERWNCTTLKVKNESKYDLFGSTLRSGNQEAAFITAVSSAALIYRVTRACSAGNLTQCTCGPRYAKSKELDFAITPPGSRPGVANWNWGGCSDDTSFANNYSKKFLDLYEKQRVGRSNDRKYSGHLMNLHNNEAGRQAVSTLMTIECRCHGYSGSCQYKTCWRSMVSIDVIGSFLKSRWANAVRVKRRAKRKLRRRQKSERQVPIRKDQLVYINESPTYCEPNLALGIVGTHGRECNSTSYGPDGCSELCCGRGFDTKVEQRTEKCHCKFVWCCHVKCKSCTSIVDVHTCK